MIRSVLLRKSDFCVIRAFFQICFFTLFYFFVWLIFLHQHSPASDANRFDAIQPHCSNWLVNWITSESYVLTIVANLFFTISFFLNWFDCFVCRILVFSSICRFVVTFILIWIYSLQFKNWFDCYFRFVHFTIVSCFFNIHCHLFSFLCPPCAFPVFFTFRLRLLTSLLRDLVLTTWSPASGATQTVTPLTLCYHQTSSFSFF